MIEKQTYRVRFHTRVTHLSLHVRIDGNDKCLDQNTTVEWYVLEVDSLARVLDLGMCAVPYVRCIRYGIRVTVPVP